MKFKYSFKLMTIISYSALLLVAIFSISIFIGNRMFKIVENNTKLDVTNSFNRENQELERKLETVEDAFDVLCQNDHLIEELREEKVQETVYEKYKIENSIEQILYNTYRGNQFIDNIVLYSSSGSFMFAKRERTTPYLNEIRDGSWFQNLVHGDCEIYSNPNSSITVSSLSKPVYIIAKRIYDYRDLLYLGVMVFVIDINALTDVISELPFDPNMGIAIIDSQNHVLFQNDNISSTGINLEDQDVESIFVQNSYKEIGNERYFTVTGKIDKIDWTIISLTPESYMKKGAKDVWNDTWKISIIFSVLGCVLVILLVYQINRPINEMISAIKEVGEGKLDVRVNDISYKEFEILQDAFNQMVGKVDTLIEDVRIKEQEKQRVQMMMLETQIKPHFIYNTLDGIKWVALMQNDRETAKMIATFVKLLKVSVYTKEEFITVRDEIAYLKNYLELIETRYNTQIKFEYEIDEKTWDMLTIKLVLQPIVENSIFHGILDKVQEGIIKISVGIEDHFLIMTVKDNGVGFCPDKLTEQSSGHFSGIGIENIKKRITLWCGEECGMEIKSEINKGTTVRVIQNIRNEEVDSNDSGDDS